MLLDASDCRLGDAAGPEMASFFLLFGRTIALDSKGQHILKQLSPLIPIVVHLICQLIVTNGLAITTAASVAVNRTRKGSKNGIESRHLVVSIQNRRFY